jgi:transcription termination factor Rho
LYFDKFPDAADLEVGALVGVKMRKDKKHNRNHALSFHTIDELPAGQDFYRPFSGTIRINGTNRFGFVSDCYISPDFIQKLDMRDGDPVSGSSVCEWNDKKEKYSWTAVSVSAG